MDFYRYLRFGALYIHRVQDVEVRWCLNERTDAFSGGAFTDYVTDEGYAAKRLVWARDREELA